MGEIDFDRSLRKRVGPAYFGHFAEEIWVLAAVGIDEANRLHTAGTEVGDLLLVLTLLVSDETCDFRILFQWRGGGVRFKPLARVFRARIKNVVATADADPRLRLGHLEIVRAFLELSPEGDVRIGPMLGEILRIHVEGIGLHLDFALAAGEGFPGDRVNL